MIITDLLRDTRALNLLRSFDQKYEEFACELPESLQHMAVKSSTFKGHRSDEPFHPSSGTNPIYTCLPWLFWHLFSDLQDHIFLDLAFAGGLVSLASVLMDHLIDGQVDQPEVVIMLRRRLLRRGAEVFYTYFPHGSSFWRQFLRLHREHIRSLEIERELQLHPEVLSEEHFALMAGGKVSPPVITLAALSLASQQADLLTPLESSLKFIFTAGQLHDDVLDWRPDYEKHHFTYFLSHFLSAKVEPFTHLLACDEIEQSLDKTWLDVDHLEKAISGYKKSIEAVGGLYCPAWLTQVEEYISLAEEHRRGLLRSHITRKLFQMSDNDLERVFTGSNENGADK